MAVRVKIEGLRQLGESMRALGHEVSQRVARSMTAAAAGVIKKNAEERAPVRTGRLRKNIYVGRARRTDLTSEHFVSIRRKRRKYGNTIRNRQLGRVGKTYELDGNAFYAKFLEFGTVKMSPRPFLRPAFDSNKLKAVQKMKEVGAQRLEAAARKAKR